jgi:hypothetical protein
MLVVVVIGSRISATDVRMSGIVVRMSGTVGKISATASRTAAIGVDQTDADKH